MPIMSKKFFTVILAVLTLSFFVLISSGEEKHPQPKDKDGNLVVQLCDGETQVTIDGVKEGETLTPDQAREVANKLMVMFSEMQQSTKWTDRDRMVWEAEQKRVIEEGNKLFHTGKPPISNIGVSCDMCHPNASNTHAETYPKFQTQLKKVATLRDMINWCIENPSKGEPLKLDDPRLLALEAYITAERKGVPLDPGKH